MYDELNRLAESQPLFDLLGHYVELAQVDRESYHDRLTEHQGVSGKDLSRLYGELLGHGWLEQNPGETVIRDTGCVGECYRATSAGIRVWNDIRREMIVA